jgi:putative spermidine/putrescine transport system substrate-binding protein
MAIKRRGFLASVSAGVAAASLGPFFHVRPARADKGELVVVSWGGDYDEALRELVGEPFAKATGIKVKLDTPPENAKVKAMVEAKNVSWDVLLTDIPAVLSLAKDKLLEPMDYGALDKAIVDAIPPELRHPYAVGQRIYAFNIVYNTKAFTKGNHPASWADVWDAQRFPGGRTFNFRGGIAPQLEVALLADGVAMDKVYPLDVERAWKSMDRLKPIVSKWYVSHAEAIQLIAAGEAVVGCTIGSRATSAKKAGADVDVDYNQGKVSPDNWCLVKDSANKKAALDFINFALDPKRQAEVSKRVPYGPSNKDAFAHLTPAEAADLNTAPENLKKQFWWDVAWWGTPGADGKTERDRQAERYAQWMVKG